MTASSSFCTWEFDEDEWRFQEHATRQLSSLRQTSEPPPPGVPDVINRLMTRNDEQHVTVDEFRQTLLDPAPGSPEKIGPYACPGMPICRIAAFQDYIVASNTLRLQRMAWKSSAASPGENLLHARNYSCCHSERQATSKEIPRPESPYARLFCCCHGTHDPGMIAMVINTLLFRSNYRRHQSTGDPARDWVINIDYFKEIVCQNSHFTLNRLFGYFENKPAASESARPLQMPLYLLRILPIGSAAAFQSWFYYARALHRFLNSIEAPDKFKFYWLDGERGPHSGDETPPFETADRRGLPIVLVIKRELPPEVRRTDSQEHCDVCGLQPKEYDCHKLRAWV